MTPDNLRPRRAPAADVPDELVMLADVMSANGVEGRALTGIDVHDRESALSAARAIKKRGAKSVAVGAGDGRVLVSDVGEEWLPNHRLATVNTTGAGDACAAGIAVGLSERRSFLDACELGHAAAALATTRLGALGSLPRRQDVDVLRIPVASR